MPKLNNFLVTSIITDIKECVWVANEIYSWVGDIEHLSWKFPAKTAKDINSMEVVKEHNGTAGEFYILLLELAYDRIQFVLRLMVEFMDKYPCVDDFFKEVAYIKRPNQISLASLLRLLWDRLKTMPESISRYMNIENILTKIVLSEKATFPKLISNKKLPKNGGTSTGENGKNDEARDYFTRKVSRSSQAESTVNYCESCTMAGEAVLRTINVIERVFADSKLVSAAVTERDKARSDIYESTQWAVMARLTKGIEADVGTAMARMRESNLKTETTRQVHEETIRDLRASLTHQEKRSDTLQVRNSELQDLLEKMKEDVKKTNQKKVIEKRENEEVKETLENTRRQLAVLTSGYNILQSQAGRLAESKLELEETVIGLRKEVIESRDAYLKTEQHLQTLLDETREENDLIKNEYEKEIKRLHQEIELLRATIANQEENQKLNVFDEKNSDKKIRLVVDPIADMTQQLLANREKIELLTRQNKRLSKTLQRLKDYRSSGQKISMGSKE